MFVRDLRTNRLLKVDIQNATTKEIASVSIEFGFNWKKLIKQSNSNTYSLKFINEPDVVLGLLHLIIIQGMLIMNLVEVSKTNLGRKKRYDYIAGCLIAFACKQSFEIETDYKGFLTFNAKSELTELYKSKYHAKQINGQRMYIEPENGIQLINEYLNRKKWLRI